MTEVGLRDDLVLPFEIKSLDVRGRLLAFGPLINQIITGHDYPENVSALVAEATALVGLLGSALQFDGKLILQTRTDGPVSMLVADYTTGGHVRAYAHFDPARVTGISDLAALTGKGHLALTIDQGEKTERYQGIVALDGTGLGQAAHTYFVQSEQIPTRLKLAAGCLHAEQGPVWRAGAIMIQHVPDGKFATRTDLAPGDLPDGYQLEQDRDENWSRAELLLATTRDDELLDPLLAPEQLLYRLFHEDGVTVFPPQGLSHRCTCSRAKVSAMLAEFSPRERADMVVDGQIEVTCQFCSQVQRFGPTELDHGE